MIVELKKGQETSSSVINLFSSRRHALTLEIAFKDVPGSLVDHDSRTGSCIHLQHYHLKLPSGNACLPDLFKLKFEVWLTARFRFELNNA